jgi:hypothetical protein
MIVQFAFSLVTSAMVLVLERKAKAPQRMLDAYLPRASDRRAHAGDVCRRPGARDAARHPGSWPSRWSMCASRGHVMMMVTLALWSASLGLLIGASSKQEDTS